MESGRVLIAMNNDTSITKLKTILNEVGCILVDQARDGQECLRKMNTLRPDLAILDYDLPSMNGYEVAKVSLDDDLSSIILIVSDVQKSYVADMEQNPRFLSMVKPLNKVALVNTIELMIKNRRYVGELQKKIEELQSTLDTRKEVEKAKGLLMKHMSLSEAEAFKRIQKQSMDRGISMKEIAKAIILAYDI